MNQTGTPERPLWVEQGDYIDIADVLLLTLDAEGRVSHINRKGCEVLGYEAAEIIGESWFDRFLPPDTREAVREVFRRMMTGEAEVLERHENAVRTRAGRDRLVAWHNAPLCDADRHVIGTISSGLDITRFRDVERRQAQLLKELTDLKFALDQSAIVATTDVRGTITSVNDKFCEISKYPRAELIGQDHRLINSGYHPKAFIRDLWTTIAAGRIWRGEIRNRAKDGSLYWVDTTIVPFVDARGKPYQYMAIRYDITERKRAEDTLQKQAALTRLGEMAAVVAHEVKNPLAGISGALQVIGRRLPDAGSDRAVIDGIQQRIASLDGLVHDLLVFARPKSPARAPTPIHALLRDVAATLRHDPAHAAVEVVIGGDDATLRIDRAQMTMVFHNLALNAAQAMAGAGAVDLRVRATPSRCEIVVSDTGPGIVADEIERVFEPFVTTKHRGSGLGLPTARRIVEAHGGTLTAERGAPGGAVFIVSLPVS